MWPRMWWASQFTFAVVVLVLFFFLLKLYDKSSGYICSFILTGASRRGCFKSSEKNPLMQAPYSKIIRLLMTTLHKCLLCGQIQVSHTIKASFYKQNVCGVFLVSL
jgi:hypothetical protein